MKLLLEEREPRKTVQENAQRRASETHRAITSRLLLLLGCLRIHPFDDVLVELVSDDELPDWMIAPDRELLDFLATIWAEAVVELVPGSTDPRAPKQPQAMLGFFTEELMAMRPLKQWQRVGLYKELTKRHDDILAGVVEYRLGVLLEFSEDGIQAINLDETTEDFMRKLAKNFWRRFPKAKTEDFQLVSMVITWHLRIFRTYLETMPVYGSPSEEEMVYLPAKAGAGGDTSGLPEMPA